MKKISIQGSGVRGKKALSLVIIMFCLMTGTAWATGEQVADYTAYPPFLPRVTSPNILFMLDYSASMVRPAYGNCKTIADVGNEGVSDSDSGDINISNCRYTFSDINYDYDASTTYSGYFDTSGKYNCSGGGSCSKNDEGVWSGNFLNWLTMTQFDIVKKVVVGGDVDPAPEMGNPTKLWSKLINANNESDSDYRKFRKAVNLPSSGNSTSCSSTDLPSSLCTQWPSVTPSWVDTPATGVTTVFGASDADNSISSAQALPFPLTFYGNTYTQMYIDTNGTVRFAKEIFRDGAESGTGSWTATGLWKRQGSGDSCTNAATGSAGWYYGAWNNRDAWCNFDTGAATSGTLASGSISLPAGSIYLGFAYFYETETTSTSWDRRYVDISIDGGTSWSQLSQLSGDTMNTWWQKQIDISAYAGQPNVKIRFRFESGDAVSNGFRGWYVDDIVIYTPPTTSYSSNDDIPDTDAPNNMIAPFWDDLMVCDDNNIGADEACGSYTPTAANATSVKTFTTGTAPNRIFVTTFYKMIHKDDTGKADPLTFQVLLYEGSNHIVFQYQDVRPTSTQAFREGRTATIGVENSDGSNGKKYSYNGSTLLSNGLAIFASPHLSFTLTPSSSQETKFQPAAPLAVSSGGSRNDYGAYININGTGAGPTCSSGSYLNKYRNSCYDHETEGLLQDFRDGELGGTLGFRLAIMQLNDTDGGAVKKHFNEKDTTGWSSLMSNTRGKSPTTNTPLAEALQIAEGYFKQDTTYNMGLTDAFSWTNHGTGSSCLSTGNNYDPYCFQSAAQRVSCCKSFVLIVSSGNYSNDNRRNIYGDAADTNGQLIAGAWRTTLGETSGQEGIGPKAGWLDNVAYKAHTTDWRSEMDATQNLAIYTVNTFGAGSGTGTYVLKKAAKYGGFDDVDVDNAYDADKYAIVNGQCTRQDGGAYGEDDRNCDGKPDTYFEASGGGDLKAKIMDAVTNILKSSSSGTSVSVLSTSASGEGAIYQAYFYPARIENTTDDRDWPGYLRAFFIDKYQNMRDDSSGGTADAALVMAEDRIAQMCLNTTTNEVKVKLFADSNADGSPDTTPSTSCPGTDTNVDMDSVLSIWEAGNKLAMRTKSDRNIYTWVDTDGDGVVDNGDFSILTGEALTFVNTAANRVTFKPYLRAADDTETGNIIDFIRGNAVTGYRNRCISIVSDTGSDESGCENSNSDKQRVWALGDIVYSTPTLVSGPGEKYDQIYGDADYKSFTNKYKKRRSVIYTGANDGMLHAFNGGVYTTGDNSLTGDVESGWFENNSSKTASPLNGFDNGWGSVTIGDELWAFIPHDNLPTLAWLACNGTDTDPVGTPADPICGGSEYTHVYYVDQRPKVTDVRIFNHTASADCSGTATSGLVTGQDGVCHPGGWGTILIMGMRLGGGAINVDFDGDGDTSDAGEKSFRSAYYVFDVTDPEKKPKLLWRFNGVVDANANGIVDAGEDKVLGFTTSYPAIARICNNATNPCTGTEKWYMVVGSGPANNTGTTGRDYGGIGNAQALKVFVVDLVDGSLDQTIQFETGSAFTMMGDPIVVDADLNFTSDVIYIGANITTSTSPNSASGRVYRINTYGTIPTTTPWDKSTLYDPVPGTVASTIDPDPDNGKDMGPLLVSPSVAKDSKGNLWVFFGTGKLRNSTYDLSNSDQQRFYGIKDACWTGLSSPCDTSLSDGYSYKLTDLFNSSNMAVCSLGAGGGIYDTTTGTCGSGTLSYGSYSSLLDAVKLKKGWYLDLNNPTDPAAPSERVLSRSVILGGLLLFTAYKPTSDMCSVFGDSALYSLYYETGTAYIKPTVGTTGTGATETVKKSLDLGKGMPTAVGVAIGETVSGFVQKSTGEIVRIEAQPGLGVRSGAASWREKTGGGGTSEIETIYKHIVK